MINLKELRLNNWVYSLQVGEYVKIASIDSDCVTLKDHVTWGYVYADMIEPIPLTEEMLLKCGFEVDDEDEEKYIISGDVCDYILENTIDGSFIIGVNHGNNIIYFSWDIISLHQLQNLYFELTGEELKIEL